MVKFTPREKQVLSLVAEGCTQDEICERLGLSYHTLKTHLDNIRRKTGINRHAKLVHYAIFEGHGVL